jgi:hypothetical protein
MASPNLREKWAWSTFSKAIEGHRLLHHRVENLCGNGTPDVVCQNNYGTTFWLENKDVEYWPKRPGTAILKNAFEPGQLPWLRSWNWRGGHSFALVRIEGEYHLLDPDLKIEEMTRAQLVRDALGIGKKDILEFLYNLKNKDR